MKDKEARKAINLMLGLYDCQEWPLSNRIIEDRIYRSPTKETVEMMIKGLEYKLREDFDCVIKQVMEAAGLEGITIPATPAQQAKWVVRKKRGGK